MIDIYAVGIVVMCVFATYCFKEELRDGEYIYMVPVFIMALFWPFVALCFLILFILTEINSVLSE